MQYLVSTTGSDVLIEDLGILLIDPTVDRNLSEEFKIEELQESNDLQSAFQAGTLTLRLETVEYGVVDIDGYEYRPTLLLEQSLKAEFQEGLVSEDELSAGLLDTEIVSGTFPLPVSSTTSGTKVVVVNSATFFDWKTDVNDLVVITGGAAAGTYTVNSIVSQTQLTVVEAIPTTLTTGTLTIYHPPAATKIGIDSSNFTEISGANLQSVLDDIDSALGSNQQDLDGYLNETSHQDLDTLLHSLNEDYEVIPVFDGYGVITSITAQEQGAGDIIRDYTDLTVDSDGLITGFIVKQYDETGSETERLTSVVNISSSIPTDSQVTKT